MVATCPWSPWRVAAIVAAVAFLGFCQSARAAERHESSSLSWLRAPGGEGCIGSLELARLVEARLGRAVFASPSHAVLAVEGRVNREDAPDGERYRATITVTRLDGSTVGTRELTTRGPSCRELDEGVAMIIALLIDPEAKEFAAESKAPEPLRAETLPPPAAAPRRDIELGVGPLASLGLLPGVSFGVVGSVHLSLTPVWSVLAEGGATFPQSRVELEKRLSFDDFFGAALGCGALLQGPTRFDLCAGGAFDHLTVSGNGARDDASLGSVLAGATLARALGELVGVSVDLRAAVPLARTNFSMAALDPESLRVIQQRVFRPAPINGRLGVRIVFRF
jgi:hypothetical protein